MFASTQKEIINNVIPYYQELGEDKQAIVLNAVAAILGINGDISKDWLKKKLEDEGSCIDPVLHMRACKAFAQSKVAQHNDIELIDLTDDKAIFADFAYIDKEGYAHIVYVQEHLGYNLEEERAAARRDFELDIYTVASKLNWRNCKIVGDIAVFGVIDEDRASLKFIKNAFCVGD